jgi:hypothetical protein
VCLFYYYHDVFFSSLQVLIFLLVLVACWIRVEFILCFLVWYWFFSACYWFWCS